MGAAHHKFIGEWGKDHQWEGARSRIYHMEDQGSVSENWLIGKSEGAENFALRFYNVEPHCSSKLETHAHDHGVVILQGQADVQIGEQIFQASQGDVLYIPPNHLHVLHNTGEGTLGFLCMIPAKREKNGRVIWAEELAIRNV